ncbi:MAG: DotU family type IV/VI secretion system protein [Spirochaetaceae bacterium]|jgi:type VI protein secretion system component VasF|nr:DotU family type IV/VI secretion system protein [Spirochaetaceae bacterium]
MNSLSELEKICNPVLVCICNYWQYVHLGNHPAKEKFQGDIEFLLAGARAKAAKIPALSREYQKIEHSLVFFIDYMVKEGDFPFSRDWEVMARRYNELSGDEKFFDLMEEALKEEAPDAVSLYYLMLGLGFEGVYRGNPEYLEEALKRCGEKFPETLDIQSEPLVSISLEKRQLAPRRPGFVKAVWGTLICSALFALISLVVNLVNFGEATAEYREALSQTEKSSLLAAPQSPLP